MKIHIHSTCFTHTNTCLRAHTCALKHVFIDIKQQKKVHLNSFLLPISNVFNFHLLDFWMRLCASN